MKLTIGSKTNEWWHSIGDEIANQREEHPTIIHQWWDGLEWMAHEMPSERLYYYCEGYDFQHLVCLADHEVGDIAETFGLSGAYKFINHHVDVIKQGFESEWQNILEAVSLWTLF